MGCGNIEPLDMSRGLCWQPPNLLSSHVPNKTFLHSAKHTKYPGSFSNSDSGLTQRPPEEGSLQLVCLLYSSHATTIRSRGLLGPPANCMEVSASTGPPKI